MPSKPKEPSKTFKGKENNSDSLLELQNENQVLKLKINETDVNIISLKQQLIERTTILQTKQAQCDRLKESIRDTAFLQDLTLETERKSLLDKLSLVEGNRQILACKVKELQEAILLEEAKLQPIIEHRKILDRQLLGIRAQNVGIKASLASAQKDNDDLREINNSLAAKCKQSDPAEQKLASQVQNRIRETRNSKQSLRKQRKLHGHLRLLQVICARWRDNLQGAFSQTVIQGLQRILTPAKLKVAILLGKKYVSWIKARVFDSFRTAINVPREEATITRILTQTSQLRKRAEIWRNWRKRQLRAQYKMVRQMEVFNTLDRLATAFQRTLVSVAFSTLKYLNFGAFRYEPCNRIFYLCENVVKYHIAHFVSCLRASQHKAAINLEIETSASEQSRMLVQSSYFTAWSQHIKAKRILNRNVLYKCFKEFKGLLHERKRSLLVSTMASASERINQSGIKQKCFAALRANMIQTRQQTTQEENEVLLSASTQAHEVSSQKIQQHKRVFRTLSLLRVQYLLKQKVRRSFKIWRLLNTRLAVLTSAVSSIDFRARFALNYAFYRIQARRFAKMKASITEKIASCQYSHNYLIDENTHIKEVLDAKSVGLERMKFVKIVRKFIQDELEAKRKYFWRFARGGWKSWAFAKSWSSANKIIDRKLSIIFVYLLKQNSAEVRHEKITEDFLVKCENRMIQRFQRNAMKAFKHNTEIIKRLKRAVGGVFDRNIELGVYLGLMKIRERYRKVDVNELVTAIAESQAKIYNLDNDSKANNGKIDQIKSQIASRNQGLHRRKILALFTFFKANAQANYSVYIRNWLHLVHQQKKVQKLVTVMERKVTFCQRDAFIKGLIKAVRRHQQNELATKIAKYQQQALALENTQGSFLRDTTTQFETLASQNLQNQAEIAQLEKRTERFDQVLANSYRRQLQRNLCHYVLRDWKQHKEIFVFYWGQMFDIMAHASRRDTFKTLTGSVREEIKKQKYRIMLSQAYTRKYQFNLHAGFNIWRQANKNANITLLKKQFAKIQSKETVIANKFNLITTKHRSYADQRVNERKLRKIFDFLKKYTVKKILNNDKKLELQKWLMKGRGVEAIHLMRKSTSKKIQRNKELVAYAQKRQQYIITRFFRQFIVNVGWKRSFKNLFFGKFIPMSLYFLSQRFFSQTKNYGRFLQVNAFQNRTYKVQRVITTFNQRIRSTVCHYFRRWRRNEYEMQMGWQLLRRVTRNAMNWRVKDLFYAWKLQKEAKMTVIMHEQQGQVKRRKKEVQRLSKFLDDFKRQKGLLLENQDGNFVASPRYQEKKQRQLKRERTLKYKFVCRIILAMNGYSPSVRAWNNLSLYTKLREKLRQHSVTIRNRLVMPDMSYAFRIWRRAARDFKQSFESMERRQLIQVLRRQKERMELEYSHKIQVQQQVEGELEEYRILSHQNTCRERLLAERIIKTADQVKRKSLLTWRQRTKQLAIVEANILQMKGENRMSSLEAQLQQIQMQEMQMRSQNSQLQAAVVQALQIANLVTRISEERNRLSNLIEEKQLSCESLQEQNERLNAKLFLAQKEAMHLLMLSEGKL